MRLDLSKHSGDMRTRTEYLLIGAIIIIAVFVTSSYRGIAHDEGIGGFHDGAIRILNGQPLLDKETPFLKEPARLMYIVLIALSYKLLGINLVALHFFPYLLQIFNPFLFYVIVRRFFNNIWWGFVGAVFFIFHPFAFVYLNEQHNHPVFLFFLLLLFLLFESILQNPKMLILFGVLSSLLILTRFEDGIIFVASLYGAYILQRWKDGIPFGWLVGSFGAGIVTFLFCAWLFGFPVFYYAYYIPAVLERQENKARDFSWLQLTMMGVKNYISFFFCGRWLAPFLLVFAAIGCWKSFKTWTLLPLAIFLPHFAFLTLVYNGRHQVNASAVAALLVPGFILLLLKGIETINTILPQKSAAWRQAIIPSVVLILLVFFVRGDYALAILAEDSQPASTMWHIVTANPPLPGNPSYQKEFIQLTPEYRKPVLLREQIYKAVRGRYRSWYIHRIGEEAFERNLPEHARATADFSYFDDYESPEMWEQDRGNLEGGSPLWNTQYPGRIGAFPVGESGTFIYKFTFPTPIEHVTLSDVHTQWGFGDVTKMWTSTDGQNWTLRYDNWNVHFRQDYFYQFFQDEFDGHTVLYVRYFFHAGDPGRSRNDNRGASLEEFSLAVTYKK